MNANEISAKANPRMNRIQKISRCFRLFLLLYGILIFPDHQVLTKGTGGLFAGLLIVFVAWVFGEAQKLQEEQALTV